MMNLSEILRGIGSQMASSVPNWTAPAPSMQQVMEPFASFQNPSSGFANFSQPGAGFADFSGMPGNHPTPASSFASFPQASPQTSNATSPGGSPDATDMTAYIRHSAAVHHINPDIAVQVAQNEGLNSYVGDSGSSFGPFQLHYGGVAGGGNSVGGLGDAFTNETGLDARDPSTAKQQVDWVMNGLATSKFDWSPFHGSGRAGLAPNAGIGGDYADPGYTAPAANVYATGSPAQSSVTNQLTSLLAKNGHKLGEAYDWGGAGQNGQGFDCSGLVSWVGQQLGVQDMAPRETTATLFPKTQQIDESQAQPGDLVFYNMDDPRMDHQHVALYLGGGKILQSGGTQTNVNIGDAHQAVGSAPIFRRMPGLTQAVQGIGGQSA